MTLEKTVVCFLCVVGIILNVSGGANAKVFYNVTCGSDTMQVTLNLTDRQASLVYLQHLKGYLGCEPERNGNMVIFHLNLNESRSHCGVSKMLNKQTGHSMFYHRVVIERNKERDLLFVQCVIPGDFNMEFVRMDFERESIPYNFTVPTSSVTGFPAASDLVPYVNVAIRNKGLQLDTSTLVQPGSLLDLLVYLDREASAYYDISLRYLTLANPTRSKEEILVMNGCPVDPFVLELFPAASGVLRSQFRAFKFQSSEFVLFLATVSVCLQQCVEVECFGEADGSGRRKREIPRFLPHYSNEAFEVEVTTFLRIEADVDGEILIEESTNETLDAYDYSGDFSELVASNFRASSQETLFHFSTRISWTLGCIIVAVISNWHS